MISLIVSGHGEFANGLKSSLSLIAGDFEHINFISFINNPDQLKLDIENIIKQKPDNEFLILVDLFGGTPFKIATMLTNEYQNVKVVSGVNLPMLLSIIFNNDSTVSELKNLAIISGKDAIK